jgi:hypothetical protein
MSLLLDKMERERKVDLAVVGEINGATTVLDDYEKKVVSGTASDIKASFLAYHIIRNTRIALQKMKARFMAAEENHDNPIVAEESLSLLPVLAESFNVAQSWQVGTLSEDAENSMIEQIRILRDAMSNASMTMSEEEESEELVKTGLQSEWGLLADAVRDTYTKEQQDTS